MDWLQTTIDYGVIGLLGVMSFIAVAVAIERYLFYRSFTPEGEMNREEVEIALTRRLHLIATIGSNAPYIGLLGTVLGIMMTFYRMGETGIVDTHSIMTGLALALKATAAGLVVAIPAITAYNLLLRRAKEQLLSWEGRYGRQGV
ncbi:MAG: TonB-system energizer ExbB [Desulfuromonas sp.]|nr:MAG: TonB-system energizer ExbB [Desulfuromonas sp.]